MANQWEPMLNELAAQRSGRLLAFATLLAGPNIAEDLVQEAVIATFSKRRNFQSIGQAEQYVRRAIATKYVDNVRSSQASRKREQSQPPPTLAVDHADAVASGSAVAAALATLPPRVRACIALRYLEDLSVRETAHVLNLSEGTVKRYVADGLGLLNAALDMNESFETLETTPISITLPKEGVR